MRTLATLAMLFTGCAAQGTVIDENTTPPADWPTLEVRAFNAGKGGNLGPYCNRAQDIANGCALVNFATKTCTIFITTEDPAVMQHERMHCAGYDHIGESSMRDAWARYKAMHAGETPRTSSQPASSPPRY